MVYRQVDVKLLNPGLIGIFFNQMMSLPVSQCIPVNPGGQSHLYLRSGNMRQVPLLQGSIIHGVISQLEPLNPGGQRQRR